MFCLELGSFLLRRLGHSRGILLYWSLVVHGHFGKGAALSDLHV